MDEIMFKLAYLKLAYFLNIKKHLFQVSGYNYSTMQGLEDFNQLVFGDDFSPAMVEQVVFYAVAQKELDLFYELQCPHCLNKNLHREMGKLETYKEYMTNRVAPCVECGADSPFSYPWKNLKKMICVSQGRLGSDSRQDLESMDIMRDERLIRRMARWLKIL